MPRWQGRAGPPGGFPCEPPPRVSSNEERVETSPAIWHAHRFDFPAAARRVFERTRGAKKHSRDGPPLRDRSSIATGPPGGTVQGRPRCSAGRNYDVMTRANGPLGSSPPPAFLRIVGQRLSHHGFPRGKPLRCGAARCNKSTQPAMGAGKMPGIQARPHPAQGRASCLQRDRLINPGLTKKCRELATMTAAPPVSMAYSKACS